MQNKKYDVIIIGSGVTGTAILYILSKYTNVKSIALVDKYSKIASVNSHRDNNSQTLHFGDIETNYTLEKAKKVKKAADLLARYVETIGKDDNLFLKTHKMVLAVGEDEIKVLEKRYEEFKEMFPKLKKLGWEEIGTLEPNIVKDRNPKEQLLALCTGDGYAIDYGKLSESFVAKTKETGKKIDFFLGKKVKKISKNGGGYQIIIGDKEIDASAVVVATGSHSLIFAKQMGYGKEFGLLPVAGSFYSARNMLNGKVYTLQIDKLPFAAIHGDPDIGNPKETRFGPTAKVLPMLERHHYATIPDFLKTSVFRIDGMLSLLKILSEPILFKYVIKNFIFDMPFVGKYMFIQEVRKIVPSIKLSELKFRKMVGGIRPQIVNTNEKKLVMGEAKIIGDQIIFNITPSPGASVCLQNAYNDTQSVIGFLGKGFRFDMKQFEKELT